MKPTNRRVYAAVVLLLALSAVAKASPAAAAVAFVGEFSSMHQTSEHAYGYSVQLWRSGNELFGFLSAADGIAGNTPTGLLEDVHFDAATDRGPVLHRKTQRWVGLSGQGQTGSHARLLHI
jgi:hypothetical protein